ncbi:MAG: hypothetical protein Q4P06_09470 [Actinomycetaceae bacterium]|nr:hypothetical protein [Actinomycetaceae bacterium]
MIEGGIWTPPATTRRKISHTTLSATASVSGLIMAAFVLVHALGNLKIFQSHDDFDAYAHWLRHAFAPVLPAGTLLWVFRLTLTLTVLAHLWAVTTLWVRGRSGNHPKKRWRRARPATCMMPTGIIIAAFIIFHLFDLTIGASGSPAGNLTHSLAQPLRQGIYILALLALAPHLAHGIKAAASGLGVTNPTALRWAGHIGIAVAVLVTGINLAVATLGQ